MWTKQATITSAMFMSAVFLCANTQADSTIGSINLPDVGSRLVAEDFAGFPSDAITFEMWVRGTGDPRFGMVSYAVPASFNEFTFFDLSNLTMYIDNQLRVSGADVEAGQVDEWNHVAVAWRSSDGQLAVVINGVLEYSTLWAQGSLLEDGGCLVVGEEQDALCGGFDPAQAFIGNFRDLRLWDHFRTEAEIAANLNTLLAGNEPGLVSYWPLNDGAGQVAADVVGNNSFDLVGNATWSDDPGFPDPNADLMGTGFIYQGIVEDDGTPIDGPVDLRFTLWDDAVAGQPCSPTLNLQPTASNGIFTVDLDFGVDPYTRGTALWIAVEVSTDGGSNYTPLGRQRLAPSVHSISTRGINVDEDGNVGIGTPDANDPFEVVTDRGASFRVRNVNPNASNRQLVAQFVSDVAGVNLRLIGNDGAGGTVGSTIGLNQAGSLTIGNMFPDQVVIDFNGNVGIGTTNPFTPLTIEGDLGLWQMDPSSGKSLYTSVTDQASRLISLGVPFGDGSVLMLSADNVDALGVYSPDGGRVGIPAMPAPEARFHVRSDLGGEAAIRVDHSAASTSYGVDAEVLVGTAVRGRATALSGSNYGVYGQSDSPSGWGVFSNGRIGATGTKSFVIDHPLDPEGAMLVHYSSEAPEPINTYSGTVRLDAAGQALVTLPAYFESINTDFRYQLTAVGAPGPNLYIATEITNNQFVIAGGTPGGKVSWQIIARRNDRFMQQRGAPVEIIKSPQDQGKYLVPALYNQPTDKAMHTLPSGR